MKKKLSIVDSTFIYLLILVITINVSWIVIEELKLIKVTKEAMNYTAFILTRSVITPMILVVQLNLIHKYKMKSRSFWITVASIAILLLLRVLSIQFDILTYQNWNLGFDAIYFLILHLVAFYSHQFFQKLSYREVNEL